MTTLNDEPDALLDAFQYSCTEPDTIGEREHMLPARIVLCPGMPLSDTFAEHGRQTIAGVPHSFL